MDIKNYKKETKKAYRMLILTLDYAHSCADDIPSSWDEENPIIDFLCRLDQNSRLPERFSKNLIFIFKTLGLENAKMIANAYLEGKENAENLICTQKAS